MPPVGKKPVTIITIGGMVVHGMVELGRIHVRLAAVADSVRDSLAYLNLT